MEKRRRQILVVMLILFLMIATVPIIETEGDLASAGLSGAELTGVIQDDQGVDSDGDGLSDYLNVGVQVDVTEAEIYRVSISGLISSNGSYIDIYKDKAMYLEVGLQVVNVSLHGPTIYLSGLNPVNVSSISLQDTNWNQLSSAINVPLSREYSYTEFDAPGARLTGVIFDYGMDMDGDSFFDFLVVGVQVNVTEPRIYSVDLSSLRDANFSYIYVGGYKSEYIDVGLQVLNLSLDGPAIYASGVNPQFVNQLWLRHESYNIGSLSDVPLSGVYSYADFDAPPSPVLGASLTGNITDRGVDSDGDSKFDYLEMGIEVNVTIAKTYQVEVSSLRDAYWNYTYVWDSESSYLDVGVRLLNVTLFGPTIYAYGFNPKYVSSTWLRDENGTYLDSRYDVELSEEYLYTDFDVPGAVLTGFVSDRGVDTDSDGAFNYLEVSVEISVTEPGVYQLSLSELKDIEMNYIPVWDDVSAFFSAGTHLLNMSLDGSSIYSSSRNPRFISQISVRDEKNNLLGRLDNILLSQEYMYDEFESPTAALTGVIIDEGVDSDGDGFFDYLKVGVEINVTEAGEYRLYVDGLLDAELNYISVYDSKSPVYLDEGLQLVNVSLWGPAIYVSGLDPRLVSWIRLEDVNWNYLDGVSNIPLYRKYLHTEFDAPGAYLTGVISDKGIDFDGDGLFNYLEVGVQVNVTEAGFYQVAVSGLEDSHLSYISVYDSEYLHLIEGLNTVNLTLNGLQIYTSGLNPAFVSYIYLEDEDYRNIGSLSRIALSQEYSYTEFDPPRAVLTGTIYDWGLDLDEDGTYDYLQIGVEINVSDSGDYRVEVSGLQDSSFDHISVWNSTSGYFDPGVHVLNVSLYGPTIYRSGLNPMYVSSIYLYDDYYSYLYQVPLSQEYLYTDFDTPGAILTRVSSDYGVDTDGDGQFNYLQIEVEINVTEAGYYEVGVSGLLDADHNYISVYDSEYLYLYSGTQIVHLSLDGLQIHLSGLNPKYVDYIWLQDEKYRDIGKLDDVLLSREYSYKEFEAPSAVFTGTIYDRGVDTDGDGAFNYLEVGLEVNITEAGYYEVSVDGLRDMYGNWIGVHGSAGEYLQNGTHVLNVSLSGLTIYFSELNPSSISYASLWDQKYNQMDTLSDVPLSKEYSYNEFERPGAVLTGVISDQGIDTDADGKYDYLKIGVQVDVTDAGNYEVYISDLLDSTFENIGVYDSVFTFLEVGLQVVNLSLAGPRIYLSHRNPRYVNYIGLNDEYYTYSDSLSHIPLSKGYSYTDFDPPTAMLTGKIYDQGVDTDGDGAFNYLEIGVEINVTKPGTYEVHVSALRDTYGNWIEVWASKSGYFDVGLGVLNVSLYGPSIYATSLNPRYVNYIHLLADYDSSLDDILLSREYLYTEFDFPAVLTGVISDRGVDTDADGSFDYLEVGVQVNVSDAGTYVLYVSGLRDAYSSYINVWDSKTTYLDAGVQNVTLYLYGPQIYVTRRNPTMVANIYLSEKQYPQPYYWYYDYLSDVPLIWEYSYTDFDAPFVDVETKFVVYPDGRVGVEGALKYTDMVPQYTGPTAQGSFNLTSTHASADLTVNLPDEFPYNEFPYNSTTAEMLAEYSNGLLTSGINSTMILPPIAETVYPYNATDGTLTATYSEGILNIEVEGNTTLPPEASKQFPFNSTDVTVIGTYSPHTLEGTITFSVLGNFTFDDVNVDFSGNETDLTLNGTIYIVFGLPFDDFIIHDEAELIEMIDQLKSDLVGEGGIVWNMTGGLLNVTNLDIDYDLNSIGADITFKIDVHGDFVQALAYLLSSGRNEMLLYPVLNEAYESVLSGSFNISYSYTTLEASVKLTFSYDLKRLLDYILTPPTGTTAYPVFGYSMTPTLWMGDLVMVEEVANASDIIADPENGDIIAYYYPYDQRYVVIHRAINTTYVNGTLCFTTQGDANSFEDSWLVPEDLVIGKAVRRIPLLGYLVSYPYFYYPYYYYPYPHNTTGARLSLLKAACDSVENMSIQLSYSSVDKLFDLRLTQVDKLEELRDEIALLLPEVLPPETPPEIRAFVESILNTTYASVGSATVYFTYENGQADLEATAEIEGDINAEVNYVKDLYFQLIGAQYSQYNITTPWQLDFINQTKVDLSNFEISAKLGETSFEGQIKGLTFMPPTDALNATHFQLERFFNLTAPQYPWQPEPPMQDQRLKITVEGGSNGTHGVTIFRDPQTVPEPDATAPHATIWNNQTLSSLKNLVFNIRELGQYNQGWIAGRVVETEYLSPIVGASLTANGFTATTDANGYYFIPDVPPGDYTVTASAVGYANGSKPVHLDSGVTASVDFTLTSTVPTGTLTVTTIPVAGEVFVDGTSWGIAPQSRVVLVGTYNVSFGDVAGYYTPDWQLATVSENATYLVTGVYESLFGTIDGTVTDASTDLPIAGALITADGYFTITNESGYYEMEVAPGTYTVTAEADGYQSESTLNVTVTAKLTTTVDFQLTPVVPPVASFTYTPTDPLVDETVTFNATASYDPDGTIVSYLWDLGDGTNASGMIVYHAYVDAGTYNVTLTVTDNDNLTDTISSTVTVSVPGPQPPVADFTYSPESPVVNETVTFDPSASYDPDGTIVYFSWKFGDGTSRVTLTDVLVYHAYVDVGTYNVTLTVTDDDGLTNTVSSAVTVYPPEVQPPVASFTYSPLEPLVDETVIFNASASYDPDGTIVSYSWDFGDGNDASGELVNHIYSVDGDYNVTLTVVDDDGLTDTTWQIITVLPLTGTLTVTTTPISGEVFVNGSSWGVAPQSRQVEVGTYNVSFGSVAGYYTPTWRLATVQEDAETVVTGVYEPITGTLTITTTPVSGEVFVDGISWGLAPESRVIQIGTYNVSFGDVAGYYTPGWQVVVVSENVETSVTGVYELIPGTIDGTVTDSSTGLPIAGATVTADGYSATTDSTGYYIITDLPAGNYTVTAEATGYYSDTKTDIVVESGVLTLVNFALERLATYTLTVDSSPIFGVNFTVDGTVHTTLWSDSLLEGSHTIEMPSTWTDGANEYTFDHWEDASTNPTRVIDLTADTTITAYYEYVPETYTLTVNSEPVSGVEFTVDGISQSTSWTGELVEGSHTIVIPSTWGIYNFDQWEDMSTNPTRVIDLTSDMTITAYYVKRQWTLTVDSDPITGVEFTLDTNASKTTPYSASLIEGSHTITMPSSWTDGADVYSFSHWEDESTEPTRTITLTEHTTLTATYELYVPLSGWIDGYVTDADTDAALVGATVTANGVSVTTDSRGYYNIETVPGTYTVTASMTGYVDDAATGVIVTAGETTTVNFALASIPPTGTLSVTTTPVPGEVFVNGTSWGTASQSRVVQVGTYNVSFGDVAGYYTPTWQLVTVSQNVVTPVTGAYEPIPGVIQGTVKDVSTGLPIGGATVSVVDTTYSASTDSSGVYTIENVSPGSYTVKVSAPGYVDKSKTATVTAGKTTVLNFALTVPEVAGEEIEEPENVNATNPFIVNATKEAATSISITQISKPITIVVKNITEPVDTAPPPGTWKALGKYVQITVNNTDITVNATIRIYYTLEQLEASGLDESTLEISFWNATSGEWESVESHVNTEEHYVWAIIDHFSLFAILGQPIEGAALPTQLLFLAIAVIVIIAATAVSFIYFRRRKTAVARSSQRP